MNQTDTPANISAQPRREAFSRFAWAIVFYLVLVILWGAWVRISHSGAGCGNHWPTCNGEIIPQIPGKKTLTEYIHRLTSGLSLPLVLVMLGWAFKRFPKGHGVRLASVGTLVFLLSEAALGAGLVKFELVADDTSVARAITASLHLINTFTLSAFAALAAWWSQRGYQMDWQFNRPASRWLLPGLAGILLSCMAGAVTALGDTLFPTSLAQHLASHPASGHFLVQLRILHPILAVATAVYLIFVLQALPENHPELKGAHHLTATLVFQLGLGMVNILLGAPAWMQLAHLTTALVVWLGCLFFWLQTQEAPGPQKQTGRSA